ncbi:hypothetical protein [Dactylosporangium sp. CA-092794]|uniref:hypothetical protein n=1 Tax=Dactylosporangium sp. CA-092794 TaxID=3239929 RepID=UPI003D919DED
MASLIAYASPSNSARSRSRSGVSTLMVHRPGVPRYHVQWKWKTVWTATTPSYTSTLIPSHRRPGRRNAEESPTLLASVRTFIDYLFAADLADRWVRRAGGPAPAHR